MERESSKAAMNGTGASAKRGPEGPPIAGREPKQTKLDFRKKQAEPTERPEALQLQHQQKQKQKQGSLLHGGGEERKKGAGEDDSTLRGGRPDGKSHGGAARSEEPPNDDAGHCIATHDIRDGIKRPTESMTNSTPEDGSSSTTGIAAATTAAATEQPSASSAGQKQHLRVRELKGDLFDAPDGAVLVHACNCVGSWSAGIALAFKKKYPHAYAAHVAHCKAAGKNPRGLVGTAQLIPPAPAAAASSSSSSLSSGKGKKVEERQHWVGCLFTSERYGRRKDSKRDILAATAPSMRDLMAQVARAARDEDGPPIGEVRMCLINSGLFGVPWGETKAALEGVPVSEGEEEEGDCGVPREVIAFSLG